MEANVRPVSISDSISEFYWESAKQGRLSVQGFQGLDVLQHPTSPVPEIIAGGPDGAVLVAVEVSGQGTLFSFTILRQPFHPGFINAVPMADRRPKPGGSLPLNAQGGQLAELRLHGLSFLAEGGGPAARRVRRSAGRGSRGRMVANAHGPQCASMVLTT